MLTYFSSYNGAYGNWRIGWSKSSMTYLWNYFVFNI